MAECCGGGTRIIYACSGAADVGEIADRVARRLRSDGCAKMSCLAAVGADLSGYVQTAKGADECVSIDGCATACARKNLERVGVSPRSFVLTEMGLSKGQTPVSDEAVNKMAEAVKTSLGVMVGVGAYNNCC